ncbi:MAG: zf-HC2 domain-containing protein [bacterium]
MNCREFRHKHDAYVDDTLSGVDLEAMGRHLRLCTTCAALDTRIRRSLLIARNLPTIELSAAFSERLQMRLAHERALRAATSRDAGFGTVMDVSRRHGAPMIAGAFVALAAGIAMAAGLVLTASVLRGEDEAIRLAPVVASLPEPEPSSLAMPAMVASMPAGMPVWPAVFVAQQAPWRLASDAMGR